MNHFENITFHGTFRDYQARVLEHADQYLKDGKINIVAAPGSGKTVLGLELIRRIGQPCIILSPTTAIREQWGDRFKGMFLDEGSDFDALFSNNLHRIALLNSITYQALYTAVERVACDDDGDTDCSDVDIFAVIRENGIKTICLDEAHHLKNEWQKALEKFIGKMDLDVTIVSLTATPPYDSEGTEWSRYQSICGDIDEEIFVPELVAQNTLCPHQDYVYFNYPTEAETAAFQTQKENAARAVEEIGKLTFMPELAGKLVTIRDYDTLYSNVKEYVALMVLLTEYGYAVPEKLIRQLTTKKGLPPFGMSYAETAIQFLLDGPSSDGAARGGETQTKASALTEQLDGELLTEEQREEIIALLKKYQVYHKRKVTFQLDDALKRALISSVGKLESIKQITRSEFAAMGSKLRMLVLTDYIKKEGVAKIATGESFQSVNVVSIFETIRSCDDALNIGVLSGTLVILPDSIDLSEVKHKKQPIEGTRYAVVDFGGSNYNSVKYVSSLFEAGELQVLIGTKSLLGEGWDSPCINSLILASFVGSFVLSNQMRGRAIRIDKKNPNKTSNIWHLVTVEPEHIFCKTEVGRKIAHMRQDKNELQSCDFEVLKRRFDSFMGPNYETNVIESGIERLTIIQPPFDEAGIARINQQMLERSSKRETVASQWTGEVAGGKFAVSVETEATMEEKVPVFTFMDYAVSGLLGFIELMLFNSILFSGGDFGVKIVALGLGFLLYQVAKKLILHASPTRSMKTLGLAVYRSLRACDLIAPGARVETKYNKNNDYVSISLRNASIHDQNLFNTAIAEMFSPIENPRYILIGKTMFNRYRYSLSFACPSVLGKKKEYVEVLAEKLKGNTGNFEPVYTRKEDGRALILKCRKHSYITYNEGILGTKYRVSHWE